jgi:Peptidase inhibitor family I36
MSTRPACAVGVALAAVVAIVAPAGATAPNGQSARLQRQIDQVLQHSKPGALQIAPNQVQWPRDGVTLTFETPGKAHAARFADCPRRYACLWQDTDARGRRIQFFHYRRYLLAHYGMPRFTPQGASSYYNHQTGGARAIVRANSVDIELHGQGNLAGNLNDRVKSITLRP